MATRVRDFQAEYRRRLERAEARGLTRAQGRGHARAGETPVWPTPKADQSQLEEALKIYRKSRSQQVAARQVGVSPERFRRFLRENVEASGRGPSLKINDRRPRQMRVLSKGQEKILLLAGFDEASRAGQHLSAVRSFIRTNDIDRLKPFEGLSVKDTIGRSHPLENDPNALHRIFAAGDEVFHDVYRLTI